MGGWLRTLSICGAKTLLAFLEPTTSSNLEHTGVAVAKIWDSSAKLNQRQNSASCAKTEPVAGTASLGDIADNAPFEWRYVL
jgi:hypothetical protein